VNRVAAQPVSDERHVLAEGPLWDPLRARVRWVDIETATVLEGRFEEGRLRATAHPITERTVGAVVCADDGRLLVAGHRDLLVVDPGGAEVGRLPVVPPETASRLNDGGCDPAGRLLIGTMALDGRTGQEQLCRLEADGTLTVLDDDLTVSNGLAWSPDGRTLYSVDSEPGVVRARSYDPATGAVGERREVLRVDDAAPDGMCTDRDGNLWIAMFGAGEVRCHAPSGALLATVEVGVPHPTSVAFVGPELDRLLITTARHELDAEGQAEHPDAGRLFLADVGVQGLPVSLWDGRWDDRWIAGS
jgi:sugar lactone lactonase YvrE